MLKMKALYIAAVAGGLCLASCTPYTYFTTETRHTVQADSIPLNKIQFYVDRDVVLRREVSSGNAQVSGGVIKFENGKYIHIITLKQNTPGVCSVIHNNSLEVNFEVGDGKKLTFGVNAVASPGEVYRIFANEWVTVDGGRIGKINYDGQSYYIQAGGESARLMIKKSVIANSKVEANTMSGVKVQ